METKDQIQNLCGELKLSETAVRYDEQEAKDQVGWMCDMLTAFPVAFRMSYSLVQKMLETLRDTFDRVQEGDRMLVTATTVVLLLHTIRPDLYKGMRERTLTDREIVDGFFSSPNLEPDCLGRSRHIFEATLALEHIDWVTEGYVHHSPDKSPLFHHYTSILESEPEAGDDNQLRERARDVNAIVKHILGTRVRPTCAITAAKRIEDVLA